MTINPARVTGRWNNNNSVPPWRILSDSQKEYAGITAVIVVHR